MELVPAQVFGVRASLKDHIWYINEQTVLYPAGSHVVVSSLDQKLQRFIPCTERSEGITAIAVSPNRKLVAVAELAPDGEPATATVYDVATLKRKKVLSAAAANLATREFACMAFSADSKGLITQGGSPDWTLLHWHWEKGKLGAASKQSTAPIFQCSFNPYDSSVVCVTGDGVCRFMRVTDQLLKPLPGAMGKREPQGYLCHAWLSEDRVVVATDAGDLLVLEAGELKAALGSAPADGAPIDSIAAYSKGFVCGADDGMVYVYEKSEDGKEFYKRTKSFRVEGNPVRVMSLATSPSEEQLVCSLENAQIFVLPLSNVEILKEEEMNFELLTHSFHGRAITGLDTCVRKPLVATCSMDKSVRIWNYQDMTTDIHKTFNEEVYSVSFHPSGLHVLAGFADKLRLMNVLIDDIRTYKEFAVKACRECQFSNGGQSFAAVNGNSIQIYSSYTCENLGNLRGHSSKVRSICWTRDDSRLVSCGMDGAVYEWQLRDFKRASENVLKLCSYTCAVCTPDSRLIYAVGTDLKLKEIAESNINRDFDTGAIINQIALSNSGRVLFAGTEAGTLRLYRFPLTGEYAEVRAHSAPVTRLRVSPDDAFVFSVAEDASFFVFDLRDKDGRSAQLVRESVAFAEETLVTRSDLEEKTQAMAELKQKVEELTMQGEYQLRLKDMTYSEKLKEASDHFNAELEEAKREYDMLMQSRDTLEVEYEDKLKQLEDRHTQQTQQLEAQYQQKIMMEVERYQALVTEKDVMNEKWEEKLGVTSEEHENTLHSVTEEYDGRLRHEASILEREQAEKSALIAEFEETRGQLEEDVDREIEELREKYEARLASEGEAALRLKGENGIMRKKFTALQKDIEDQKDEISGLFASKKALHEHIASLEKDIVSLKKEIRERDETIGDKEKRIYDLKKKNQELEKFKFVLDYKIKELKKQIEPREVEVVEMKEQIKQMDGELERAHKNSSALELTISAQKLKLEGMQREIRAQRTKIGECESSSDMMCRELYDCVQLIQDPKALKAAVNQMYQRHVATAVVTHAADTEVASEHARQRECLEKSVESLKRKLNKNMELHRADNQRMMQENVALINEINELRREIKALKATQVASGPRHKGGVGSDRSFGSRGMRGGLEDAFLDAASFRSDSREELPPL